MRRGGLITITALFGLLWDASAMAQNNVLRFVPYTNLANTDPVAAGIYVTRNFGYMVYDTLYSFDAKWQPQPQMIETHTVSADGLLHQFTLRDGLAWHDGNKVRAQDCVVSLQRWMRRDGFGVFLGDAMQSIEVIDDRSFSLHLKVPFPLIEQALAKISGVPAFMMPERLARTEPTVQASEVMGSGPYKFVPAEWVPGSKVVLVRNEAYVPRKEPPSNAAGGKVAKFDHVEWIIIPDGNTAVAALGRNEVDWIEQPLIDLAPIIEKMPDATLRRVDPLGAQLQFRPNFLAPPFDNAKVRQAMALVVDQAEYLSAFAGDQSYWQVCQSFFACGTPYETKAGAGSLGVKRDPAKARQLLKEAGYAGEKVVILDPPDVAPLHAAATIVARDLASIGMAVDLQVMTFSSVLQHIYNIDNARQGKWNLFVTYTTVPDTMVPATNIMLRAGGTADGIVGWPTDEQTQALRREFIAASTEAERHSVADRLNARAWEQVIYLPVGQFVSPMALSKHLTGILESPLPFFWNVEKN
jgi:peptide/nickel transport system substrate-binding protein